MKTFVFISFMVLASSISFAKAPPTNQKSLTSLMQEVRDPFFNGANRKQQLEFTQTKMKSILAKELKTTPDKLAQKFIEDKTKMDVLWTSPWIELQTEFYTTLHQETLYHRWIKKTKNKKITDYGNSIADAMILHLGKYSGIKEGRLYNRWNNVGLNKKNIKTKHKIPSFIFASNLNDLLSAEDHLSYKDLLPNEKEESLSNPSLSTLKKYSYKKSADDLQELSEVIQLNHRIYQRAVANASKTVASVHYLTGEYTLSQTESKVANFIDNNCEGCSTREKEDFKKAAIIYVKNIKAEF
jgi:hypothetical protein